MVFTGAEEIAGKISLTSSTTASLNVDSLDTTSNFMMFLGVFLDIKFIMLSIRLASSP